MDKKVDIYPAASAASKDLKSGLAASIEASSKSPTSLVSEVLSKSPSELSSYETSTYYPRRRRAPVHIEAPKLLDYSKRENNVSFKYLRMHAEKMARWRACTLETLISQQDCAVEAVKLERLLTKEIQTKINESGEEDFSRQDNKKAPSCYALTTTEDKRRLYNLLKY